MILPTGIIVMIIAAALLMLLRYQNSIEEENRLLETSIETARMYSEALERRTEKIRRLRHDTLGLLQAMENAVGKGEVTESKTSPPALLGMPLPDAIIELKRKQCRENGIAFAVSCESLSGESPETRRKWFPDETDLSLLLQNLLDNAYEANLRIAEEKERAMSLEISPKGKVLTVRVSNSLPAGENPTFNTRKQNPELHGIGMKVIDEIVGKYNGRMLVTRDDNENILTIETMLGLPHQI